MIWQHCPSTTHIHALCVSPPARDHCRPLTPGGARRRVPHDLWAGAARAGEGTLLASDHRLPSVRRCDPVSQGFSLEIHPISDDGAYGGYHEQY